MNEATGTTTLASALAFEIQARRNQALQDRIDARNSGNPPPRTYSYLSAVEECDRMMVYSVTNPKDRAPIDTELKARFEAGEYQENQVNVELRQLGFEIVLQQEVIEIKDRQGNVIGRGKIDGKILYHGHQIPVEVKSMHPQIFEALESLADFQKKPHLRKYIRQMSMYLYGNNVEEGLFIVTDCLGHWKIFVVTLDYAEGEQILQRLERVHKALSEKQLPDRIQYREEVCGRCAFASICLPYILRDEMNVLLDEDLVTNLERREQTKDAKSEYERADKWVKEFLKKHEVKKGVAGEFLIIGKTTEVKEKLVPAYTMTRYDIQRVQNHEKKN